MYLYFIESITPWYKRTYLLAKRLDSLLNFQENSN